LLAVFYGLTLVYLFLGIGIVSEVFMAGIERITSQTTIIQVKDDHGEVVRTQKITVWNPTIANLTLMALGSSAPEILLSVIETTGNLGGCPGELGASTIVGSAAFNLLVISAVSIYAVNAKNDTDPERDGSVPVGVKKIYDMGVFCVTAFSSIFAYVWIWIVLADQSVSPLEAWLTLIFFFVLIGSAFGMDKYKAMQVEKEKQQNGSADEKAPPVSRYSAKEIYEELISEKQGKDLDQAETKARREEMRSFIKETQQTDQIEKVNMQKLKQAVEGETLIGRIKYRRQVGAAMTGKRELIAKGEIVKDELLRADDIADSEKNEQFGFQCLHYSVSESSGHIRINIVNKRKVACKVRVCTEDKEALAGEDYEAVDTVLEFGASDAVKYVDVKIMDDDDWEPDEDFYVQLKDPESGTNLVGKDCRTRVTIIDDD
jgi:solute carrier family 8 (sodium/calcium exchanger)